MPANRKLTVPVPQLGIDKSQAAWVIDAQHAVKVRDILLDQIGYARRRGPFALVSGPPAMTYASPGLTQVSNPQGAHRVAIMQGDGAGGHKSLSFLASGYASVASSFTWPHAIARATIFDAKPAMKRGTLIGTSDRYDGAATVQALALWRGAINTDTAGGVTITATRGSKTVTGSGSFDSTVTPGAFLFAESSTTTGTPTTFIGVVQSISGSTVTLEEPALASVTAGKTPDFRAVRGVNPRVTTGAITCATGSATVNGGGTRFKSQDLGTGTWQLYRARDLTYIGEVSSVTSNILLTLGASAAIAMDNELYIAIRMDGDFTISTTTSNWGRKLGFITAAYAGRQWYANSWRTGDAGNYQYRMWYSSVLDPEAVDVSEDGGSWIPINSTSGYNYPIIGLFPTYAGLLIAKQNEILILTGDDPSNFSVRQLLGTDGTLGPGTFVQHEGGAIWAGKRGVYMFDGVSVNDVSASLGDGYQAQMIGFNPETYRAYAFKHRNHYHLSVESTTGEVYTFATVTGGEITTGDDILTTNSSTLAYMIGDEDLGDLGFPTGSGLVLEPGLGNLAAPGQQTHTITAYENTTPATLLASTDVPTAFASDPSTKRYWFGPMNPAGAQAGSQTLAVDTMRLTRLKIEHTGVVKQVKCFLDGAGSGTGSQVCKAVVYSDSAGTADTLLATSDEVTVTDGQAFGAVTFTFSGGETIPHGTIHVGIHGGGNTNTIRLAYGNFPSLYTHALSTADTYVGGAAATYVGNASTDQASALGIAIDAAPTPHSFDFSDTADVQYPDAAGIGNQPFIRCGTGVETSPTNSIAVNLSLPFSVGSWVKITEFPAGTNANSQFAGICGRGSSSGAGNTGFGLWYDHLGVVYFTIGADGGDGANPNNSTQTLSTAAGTVTTGVWYHIVGTYDGTTANLYIDGLVVETGAITASGTYDYMEWGRNQRDVAVSGQNNYHHGKLFRPFFIQDDLSPANIVTLANPQTGSGSAGTTLTQQTFVLNLYSGAWSLFTNFMHRGGINLPAETGKKTWAILTNASDVAKLVEVESMYTSTGNADAETSETSSQKGPRLFLEYRRSGIGDDVQLAYWKDVLVKILATGDELEVFAVPDIENTVGYAVQSDVIATDTNYDPPKVVRIQLRNTHMGLRIYETVAGTTLTDAKIGPAEFTFKPMRLGRDVHADS